MFVKILASCHTAWCASTQYTDRVTGGPPRCQLLTESHSSEECLAASVKEVHGL